VAAILKRPSGMPDYLEDLEIKQWGYMKKLFALLIVLSILQSGAICAEIASPSEKVMQPTAEEFRKILSDFDGYAAKAMVDWKVPGMAIGIVRDGNLVFAKGYGVKRSGGKDPVTENTIFQIGSTTKAFTAVLASMLVDEKKFKWEDKVVDLTPDFMMYDPWVTREFQVIDLMSQHSGMPAYAADSLYMMGFDRAYVRKSVRYIKPVSSFRSKFAYVNNLWLVAEEIIEKYSGKPWEQLLKERIFNPLKMTNSSADMQSFLNAKDVSSLHELSGDKVAALPKNWEFLSWSYVAGPAGSINSNIVDMAKWLIFQMNNGKADDKQLVSVENMNVIHSPKTVIGLGGEVQKNIYYCMGWIYHEHSPYPIIWHDGGTTMRTMIAYVPEQKIGIIVLSNYVTNLPNLLAFRFIDQYALKNPKDYSSEGLAEMEKMKREEKAKSPVPPKRRIAPIALEKYAGAYSSDIYGDINISVVEGKLNLVIGPKKVTAVLAPWNKDIFAAKWPFSESDTETAFAIFHVDLWGNVTGVTLDSLNQDDDLGVFRRK